ncbi:MAG: UDP-glucose 4-epimerase GalE [Desulfurivibrionaceae bacterium]
MRILVCGGAGYIGSHMAKMLVGLGHSVTVFDNLSTGHRHLVKWGGLVEGDLLRPADLKALFDRERFDGVMHFSARSLVGESIRDPDLYYRNNVTGTENLLRAMREAGLQRFVFSSSAAVYGNPIKGLIDEAHPARPINPYGETKLRVEEILQSRAAEHGLRSVSLRYFNAAGADPQGETGELHNPETHLIPNVLRAAKGESGLQVFGNDYGTPDTTCIRDYIHVNDLCRAHLQALEFMEERPGAHVFNLGIGKGFSILEIIRAAEKVVGKSIPFTYAPRRPGDPPVLVADSTLARKTLGWQPEYIDHEEIIRTAWRWMAGGEESEG